MNCYNSDLYLKEAIESVFKQTYENWEIIFWDNNSSDQSSHIALSFMDERIKYFKAENTTPLYNARNLALDKCSGDYISFLDCDDIWLEHKLKEQISLALRGYDFVYGGYATVNQNGEIISENIEHLVSGNITNSLFKRNPISIGTVLINKTLLQEYRFDPLYDLLGDLDMWVRLSFIYRIVPVKNVVEYSRQHETNTSTLLKEQWKSERRYFYKKFFGFSNILKNPWLFFYILKTELSTLVRGV